MVDYRKWDKFINELSNSNSEDEEEKERFHRKPRVTKLESNSKVTLDSSGATIYTPSTLSPSTLLPFSSTQEERNEKGNEKPLQSISSSSSSSTRTPSYWITNGSYVVEKGFYWSQTRDDVIIRCLLSSNVKSKEIKVKYHNHFDNINKKVIGSLDITTNASNQSILSGNLRYEIDTIDGSEIEMMDWEVVTVDLNRYIELTMKKKTIPGAIIWWDRVFVNDHPIHLENIQGRKTSVETTKSIWEEAHRMFRERIANQSQSSIDISTTEEES